MKTKTILPLALALIVALSACGKDKPVETPTVSAPPPEVVGADPTFESESLITDEGMQNEYVYTFKSGTIVPPTDAYLIMIDGEFIAQYAETNTPAEIAKLTEGIENAVVTTIPARLISENAIISIETAAAIQTLDTTALIAALKPQLQIGLDALKAADYETFSMGRLSDASEESLNATFDEIQAKIDDLSFTMQAGRYAIFDGPHTIVIDTAADNALYRHYAGHAYGGLYVFDSSDPESFLSGFFFG